MASQGGGAGGGQAYADTQATQDEVVNGGQYADYDADAGNYF